MACVMTLAVFDVTKTVENGVVIEPVHEYTTGTIRQAFLLDVQGSVLIRNLSATPSLSVAALSRGQRRQYR